MVNQTHWMPLTMPFSAYTVYKVNGARKYSLAHTSLLVSGSQARSIVCLVLGTEMFSIFMLFYVR